MNEHLELHNMVQLTRSNIIAIGINIFTIASAGYVAGEMVLSSFASNEFGYDDKGRVSDEVLVASIVSGMGVEYIKHVGIAFNISTTTVVALILMGVDDTGWSVEHVSYDDIKAMMLGWILYAIKKGTGYMYIKKRTEKYLSELSQEERLVYITAWISVIDSDLETGYLPKDTTQIDFVLLRRILVNMESAVFDELES